MYDRKTKENENTAEVETEEPSFLLEPRTVEVGSGYTLRVKYDQDQNPTINLKTYGTVDTTKVRREISRIFPRAQIFHINQPGALTVTRTAKKRNTKKKR